MASRCMETRPCFRELWYRQEMRYQLPVGGGFFADWFAAAIERIRIGHAPTAGRENGWAKSAWIRTAKRPMPQIDRIAGRIPQIARLSMANPTGKPPSAVHCNQSEWAWLTMTPGSNVAKAGYTAGQQPSPHPTQGCAAIMCNVEKANCIRPAAKASEENRADAVSNPTINVKSPVAPANVRAANRTLLPALPFCKCNRSKTQRASAKPIKRP